MQQNLVQTTNCNVGCGLYVLRYVESIDGVAAPNASVRPAPGYENLIAIVGAPGRVPGHLDRPGSAVVVISQAPGLLEISIESPRGSETPNAQFALELLTVGLTGLDAQSGVRQRTPVRSAGEEMPPWATTREKVSSVGLEIVAHVSRLGDVGVDVGQWIAGPNAPAPIEGLSVRSTSDDLAVLAQFSNSLRPDRWSPWQSADFIGTRQQASPLFGLKLKLDGQQASAYELSAEALFLGAPIVKANGREVEIVSNSGSDPLIGLRLELRKVLMPVQQLPVDNRQGRVRVFRTSEYSA